MDFDRRKELKNKLKKKINSLQNDRLNNFAKKIEINKENEKVNNDSRITDEMKNSYNLVKSELPELNIKPPNYLLDNLEETREQFNSYLVNIIEISKLNKISPDEFTNILNNSYNKYMVCVCGIEILPEKLRSLYIN